MTKVKAFTHNGRQLEVHAVRTPSNSWVVSVRDGAGLTVSTTGSIPRWAEPAPGQPAAGPFASVDALIEHVIAEVSASRMPLLP